MWDSCTQRASGLRGWIARTSGQCLGRSPFSGTVQPTKLSLRRALTGPGALPFPHPWNYHKPLDILAAYFVDAERETGRGRHNRYLDVPGFAPVLVTRDPDVIKAISAASTAGEDGFDRDTMPSRGIARATGEDSLLYANGPTWKRQKQATAPPFSRSTMFKPERFESFGEIFSATVTERLSALRSRVGPEGESFEIELESEIKAIMLELLVVGFFGAEIDYGRIRDTYVPALERVIDDIVRDTILSRFGIPIGRLPAMTGGLKASRAATREFEALTDAVLEPRRTGCGLWAQFRSDAPDAALRSNIRVFLAGALEATTSYASWAIAHLARDEAAQRAVLAEVQSAGSYTPEVLAIAANLGHVLEETLRLTPSLYFHPRCAVTETVVRLPSDETLTIPAGTHILLDVWHANRHDDHWGEAISGYAAETFAPDRWSVLASRGMAPNERPHFGFGFGPRFCPGKSLGQMEVALVVGACVKLFEISASGPTPDPRVGVSTKPSDGVRVRIRERSPGDLVEPVKGPVIDPPGGCPFAKGA